MKIFLTTFASPLLTAAMLMGGFVYFHEVMVPELNPAHPVVNVSAEASKYGKDILMAYGKNAVEVATKLRVGGTLAESSAAFASANSTAMKSSFDGHFRSIVTAILPEGGEPSTAEQRESLARFFEQLGSGVKGVAK